MRRAARKWRCDRRAPTRPRPRPRCSRSSRCSSAPIGSRKRASSWIACSRIRSRSFRRPERMALEGPATATRGEAFRSRSAVHARVARKRGVPSPPSAPVPHRPLARCARSIRRRLARARGGACLASREHPATVAAVGVARHAGHVGHGARLRRRGCRGVGSHRCAVQPPTARYSWSAFRVRARRCWSSRSTRIRSSSRWTSSASCRTRSTSWWRRAPTTRSGCATCRAKSWTACARVIGSASRRR